MAADPDSLSWVAKVAGGLAAVVVPVLGARSWVDRRFEKKADKEAVAEQFQTVTTELTIQRGHIAKVFDKLGEAEAKNEERHRELLMHLLEKNK